MSRAEHRDSGASMIVAIGTVLNGSGWILTLTAGSNGAAPTFACS